MVGDADAGVEGFGVQDERRRAGLLACKGGEAVGMAGLDKITRDGTGGLVGHAVVVAVARVHPGDLARGRRITNGVFLLIFHFGTGR